MAIARIVDNAIVEQRDIDITDVPAHKRAGWRPVEGTAPDYNRQSHILTGPAYQIEESRVLRVWTVKPIVFSADDVRAEAQRRMISAIGARDAEHLSVLISNAVREQGRLQAVIKGIPGLVAARKWTADEVSRAQILWASDQVIEEIRAKSNVLEAMSPIPSDYTADKYWT